MVGGSIGALKIGGDLASVDAAHPVTIAALGTIGATKAKQAVALKTLNVVGDVLNAQILAGYRRDLTPVNPDASIGTIMVKGNWGASSVAAGVADVTGDGFGHNDALIPGDTTPGLLSRIARITIDGSATGSSQNDRQTAVEISKWSGRLRDSNILAQVDVLNCVKKLDAVFS